LGEGAFSFLQWLQTGVNAKEVETKFAAIFGASILFSAKATMAWCASGSLISTFTMLMNILMCLEPFCPNVMGKGQTHFFTRYRGESRAPMKLERQEVSDEVGASSLFSCVTSFAGAVGWAGRVRGKELWPARYFSRCP
jgi:hypothetical protein